MLIDQHFFQYAASVSWPAVDNNQQLNWVAGVEILEHWLQTNVGKRPSVWAWHDGQSCYRIGVAFRWEQDRTLFLLRWT